MKKILIAFASMSGNTEDMADLIESHISSDTDFEIEKCEIEEIDVRSLSTFDGILLGTYTWGDGELPYEVEDFYDELEEVDLSGTKSSVFGSGDTAYPLFCEAVMILQTKLEQCGSEIVIKEGLKIELTPEGEEDLALIENFSKNFTKKLK